MKRKTRLILSTFAVLTIGMFVFPMAARAACNRVGGSGSDDIYSCTNPADTNGVSTGGGSDRITIAADTTVSGGSITVDAGSGSDYVENRGTISATYDAVHGRDGANDTILNYGTITAQDDGIWCSPRSGQTCTIRNYGTLTTTQESIDIYNTGGRVVVYNQGWIQGGQETMHFHGSGQYEVENRGTVQSNRTGIESYQGQVSIRNTGLIYAARSGQNAILLYTYADTLINSGTVRATSTVAVYMHGGSDVLHNTGTIETKSSSSSSSAVMMGPGSDRLTTSGNILETGVGYAAIAMNDGNDTLTIRGGRVQGRMYGNGGSDILIFELTGSSSEISAFRNRVNSQSPSNGSATWRGSTYQWREFESIRMTLTVGQVLEAVFGVFLRDSNRY